MKRIVQKIMERRLGALAGIPIPKLHTIFQRGGSGVRIRVVRELALREGRGGRGLLLECLNDSIPGIRRAAAHAIGLRAWSGALEPLQEATKIERCDEVRLAMAVAAVRLGVPVSDAWRSVERHSARKIATWYGPKSLGEAVGFGRSEAMRRWRLALDPDSDSEPFSLRPRDPEELRRQFLERSEENDGGGHAIEALGAQQNPEDLEWLLARSCGDGGKVSHAAAHALGLNGDPRARRHLSKQLRGLGLDPGHGFQARRAAALALGRIGTPEVASTLIGALEDEALEYEGRPGAGLGIQIPVRAYLLYALGESGSRGEARRVAGYIANTSGTVLGGFYLPAMDALVKLGEVDVVSPLLRGPEMLVANAIGVLGALGRNELVEPFLDDTRERVSSAARVALALQFSSAEVVDVPDDRSS